MLKNTIALQKTFYGWIFTGSPKKNKTTIKKLIEDHMTSLYLKTSLYIVDINFLNTNR